MFLAPAAASAQAVSLAALQAQLDALLQQMTQLQHQSSASTATSVQSASFSASPRSGTAPLSVTFSSNVGGTITFGDGATSTSMTATGGAFSASHTYVSAGSYTATLMNGNFQCSGSSPCPPNSVVGSLVINVGTSTSPRLSISSVDMPASVTFGKVSNWTVHAASATTTDTLMYSAVWGDGSSAAAQNSGTLAHTFLQSGSFTATFVVADVTSKDYATTSVPVIVSDEEGTATSTELVCPTLTTTLGVGMTDGQTNGQVTELQQFLVDFFNLADGTAAGYFGEGNVGTFGPKTLKLVNKFQAQNGISQVPFVGPKTRAAIKAACQSPVSGNFVFTATPDHGKPPLTVDFSYSDPNQGDVFNINYGDGGTGSLVYNVGTDCTEAAGGCGPRYDALYTYQNAGTYTAILTQVIDPCHGNPACRAPVSVKTVATTSVMVSSSAATSSKPVLSASPVAGRAPLAVVFNETVGTAANSLDFGDGSQPSVIVCHDSPATCWLSPVQLPVSHTYTAPGTYDVVLKDGTGVATTTISVTGAPSSSAACVALSHNLFLDIDDAATGGDVTKLQKFLIDAGLMPGPATGFFGPITQKAVQTWQSDNSIVSSGTADTTGFGFVGPKTRLAMAHGCPGGQDAQTASSTPAFSAAPQTGAPPLTVVFTIAGVSRSASVDFGDGETTTVTLCGSSGGTSASTSTSASPSPSCAPVTLSHTYVSAGKYTALLTQCPRLDYDPANPLSFVGLGDMQACGTNPAFPALLGKVLITVTGSTTSTKCSTDTTAATTGGSGGFHLSLTKTSDPVNGCFVKAGDTIKYHLRVQNDGGNAQTDLTLRDVIPTGTTYVDGSLSGGADTDSGGAVQNANAFGPQGKQVWWGWHTSAAGSDKSTDFSVKVDANAADGTKICNKAWVDSIEVLDGVGFYSSQDCLTVGTAPAGTATSTASSATTSTATTSTSSQTGR